MVRCPAGFGDFVRSHFRPGILTLQPSSQPQTKKDGLARHQVAMLLLGFPAIAVGTSAMIYIKYAHGAPHFTSWHGVRHWPR